MIFTQSPTTPIEPTTSLSWIGLRKEIGYWLGYTRSVDNWSTSQAEDVQAVLDSGLREFASHDWSFLKPYTTLTTARTASFTIYYDPTDPPNATTATVGIASGVLTLTLAGGGDAGTNTYTLADYSIQNLVSAINALSAPWVASVSTGWHTVASDLEAYTTASAYGSSNTITLISLFKQDYELPADCGGIVEEMFITDESYRRSITIGSPSRLQQLRATDIESTGEPYLAAVVPNVVDGSAPQRWTVMLYPRPGDTYSITYRYRLHPDALSSQAPWPPGGPAFVEILKRACIAQAEQHLQGVAGPQTALYEGLRQRALAEDGARYAPHTLGRNSDMSDDRMAAAGQWYATGGAGYHGSWDSMVTRYNGQL